LRKPKDTGSEIYRHVSYSHLSKHPVGGTTPIVPIYTLMLAIRL
jgi:hypothetical protein